MPVADLVAALAGLAALSILSVLSILPASVFGAAGAAGVCCWAGLRAARTPAAIPQSVTRGVVIAMLGCFLVGLLWICTFYVFSDDLSKLPIFNDLGQWNLVVGIALMAVGFSFATKWE